jgi:peptidoglycan/xylan/chitin deacetylase (PgdA/CDA1 family)
VFDAQLRHLRRHYRIVPVSELQDAVRSRRRGRRFPVALTFDDDLASHAAVAAPLLRRHGLPATFFLCGATLDQPNAFWWERLQFAVDEQLDVAEQVGAGGGIRAVAMRVVDSPRAEQAELLDALEDIAAPGDAGLQDDAVRALTGDGLGVGFHTLRHPTLTRLDDAHLEQALREGRERLEQAAGARLDTVAYPHGRADERVAAAAREAGFGLGFTTRARAVTPASDPLLLGRIEAPFDSAASLATAVARMLVRARPSEHAPEGADGRK